MTRQGESSYNGRDANGDPSGFSDMPTAHARKKAKWYPARCAYCKHRYVLKSWREHNTHMTVSHPA